MGSGGGDEEAIDVLIVDDHGFVREGLRTLLKDDSNLRVVGEAGTAKGGARPRQEAPPRRRRPRSSRSGADQSLTLGGQQRLLDVSTFNTWIEATNEGRDDLAALYERRFSSEFKVAFDAWIALDPLTNPGAPPGPGFMPEYVNPQLERAGELNEISDRLFDEGTDARVRADGYIRTTVVLATILFLLALSQRFHLRQVRLGVLAFSGALLVYGLITMVFLPRL